MIRTPGRSIPSWAESDAPQLLRLLARIFIIWARGPLGRDAGGGVAAGCRRSAPDGVSTAGPFGRSDAVRTIPCFDADLLAALETRRYPRRGAAPCSIHHTRRWTLEAVAMFALFPGLSLTARVAPDVAIFTLALVVSGRVDQGGAESSSCAVPVRMASVTTAMALSASDG